MLRSFALPLVLLLALPAGHALAAARVDTRVDEVVVTASLRADTIADLPLSLSVLDAASIEAAALQHFEELIPLVPNLNWSGEGSRARYFQLRGVGELEQYEGAPNPSVGFLLDDIDLSAIGGVATLFDLDRIEVLRGPQAARYGANALGGLIYARSAEPTASPLFRAEITAGSDATRALGLVAGGALPGTPLQGRLAVQQFRGDGFRDNAFLGRGDTNHRDELTLRGKLRWDLGSDQRADLTLLHIDADNGYDAFAQDNSLRTNADRPGRDAQASSAASLRLSLLPTDGLELVSITAAARSDIDFGFDADWGSDPFWQPLVYDYTQTFARERKTLSQELRLGSRRNAGQPFDWTVGAWWLRLDETNFREDRGRFCASEPCAPDSALDKDVASDYAADNVALFGELVVPLAARTDLQLGLRLERRSADYVDATTDRLLPPAVPSGAPATDLAATDRLVGGDLALRHRFADGWAGWLRAARGYRAGNFNPSLAGVPELVAVAPEWLWNYEAGTDLTRDALRLRLSVFRQDRRDMQVRIPLQLDPGDPTTFLFATENVQRGHAQGVEVEARWQVAEPLALGAALGLLDTEVRRFVPRPELASVLVESLVTGLEGRAFPHAPGYTASVNAELASAGGWFLRADLAARGSFFFDYCLTDGCGAPRSRDYRLLDLRAGRSFGPWRAELFGRNVLDQRYASRGFLFDNDPRDDGGAFTSPTTYLRLGDPRQIGLTISYRSP